MTVRCIEWATRRNKGDAAVPTSSSSSSSSSPPRCRRILERPLWRRTADCTVLQIRQKLSSYVHQDLRKGRAVAGPALTVAATLAMLEAVQYLCTYCRCAMKRVWRTPRDPQQWTLDRIDNDRPHQIDNVVPSCMECNLRRRARSHQSFRSGAEIVAAGITKVPAAATAADTMRRRRRSGEWIVVKEE